MKNFNVGGTKNKTQNKEEGGQKSEMLISIRTLQVGTQGGGEAKSDTFVSCIPSGRKGGSPDFSTGKTDSRGGQEKTRGCSSRRSLGLEGDITCALGMLNPREERGVTKKE